MRKRPLSVGCLVVVILICIVTSLSRKEPWSCPELEGQTVIVQGRVYQKEVKTQGGQDKTVVYLKQVSFTGDNPVEGQSEEGQSVVQEEAAEGQLLVQEKAAERQLLVQEEAAEKQLLVQGKCAEKPADTKATENILCYLREGVPEPEIGSLVILKGTLKNFQQPTNPGQFNAPFYYQILRISFRLNQAEIQVKSDRFYKIAEGLYQLRRKAGSKVDALLLEQEASVMKTMLLGEKGILDEEIKGLYQRNGIAHILAISGVKTLKLDIPLVPETRINWAFVPLHIAIIYILKLCLGEEIIPRCRFPCSRGYHKKYINWQKKQSFSVSQSYRKS